MGVYYNRYDIDSRNFIDKCNITLPAARKGIYEFVTGLKELQLWASTICWPMRSSYNAGTGNVLYGLGGLGVYDGILTNSPVWGTNGITTNGTNYVLVQDAPTLINYSFINFSRYTNTTNGALASYYNSTVGWSGTGGSSAYYYTFSGTQGFFGTSTSTSALTLSRYTDKSFLMAGIISNNTNAFVFNEIQTLSTSRTVPTLAANRLIIGGREAPNNILSSSEHAMTLITSSILDQTLINKFYTLYKNTLGIGLGLP